MALEDRIRSSVDSALSELTARLDKDVRAVIQQLVTVALEEREDALAVVRRDTMNEATRFWVPGTRPAATQGMAEPKAAAESGVPEGSEAPRGVRA